MKEVAREVLSLSATCTCVASCSISYRKANQTKVRMR